MANEKKVITFPKGLPGFEEEKSFILSEEEGIPLAQLDSERNKEIGFVLLRPQLFFSEYLPGVDLTPDEIELMEIGPDDQVDVWAIMTLCLKDMSLSTVNLRAPLIINSRTNKGIQIILGDESFSYRQQIFSGMENHPGAEGAREGAIG
ncbi:MAG: flagellar assembly protein FliW [Peptococcaceae bacterium]|nr:flagellar assembly protein FliW [Peptococcaceae bacterium]